MPKAPNASLVKRRSIKVPTSSLPEDAANADCGRASANPTLRPRAKGIIDGEDSMLDVACSIGAATDELTSRLGASRCPKTAGTKLCTDDKASIIKPQAIILDANAILLVAIWKAARTRAALERLENALGCVTISLLSLSLSLSLSNCFYPAKIAN